MGEFCYNKCHQVLVWKNFVLVSVIRFWYGRILLWYVLSASGTGEFSDGKFNQVLVWKNFFILSDFRFWYGRML